MIPTYLLLVARVVLYRPAMYSLNKIAEKIETKNRETKFIQPKPEYFQDSFSSEDFVRDLTRVNILFQNQIYTEKEYLLKKKKFIEELRIKKINMPTNEFLLKLITLKEKGILTSEDIKMIKELIV